MLTAKQLLDSSHPLHTTFVKWCKDKTPTKRQASRFLQKYPAYRKAA